MVALLQTEHPLILQLKLQFLLLAERTNPSEHRLQVEAVAQSWQLLIEQRDAQEPLEVVYPSMQARQVVLVRQYAQFYTPHDGTQAVLSLLGVKRLAQVVQVVLEVQVRQKGIWQIASPQV